MGCHQVGTFFSFLPIANRYVAHFAIKNLDTDLGSATFLLTPYIHKKRTLVIAHETAHGLGVGRTFKVFGVEFAERSGGAGRRIPRRTGLW